MFLDCQQGYTGNDGYESVSAADSSYGYGSTSTAYGHGYNALRATTIRPYYALAVPSYTSNSDSLSRRDDSANSDHATTSLAGMQSGRTKFAMQRNATDPNPARTVSSRSGYDEDIPLGGISSLSSSTNAFGTSSSLNSPISRQDNNGYGSVPPAYPSGPISPSYYSAGYSGYGSPTYPTAAPTYSSGNNNPWLPSYGYSSYRNPLLPNYRRPYGASGYAAKPYSKKSKKHLNPYRPSYGYASGYGGGYGSPGYGLAPYDYYYEPPTWFGVGKYAVKSLLKSMFKPLVKLMYLPFDDVFYA